MSIQEISGKFKDLIGKDELFMGVLVVLVGVASFGLGRMSLEAQIESQNTDTSPGFTMTTNAGQAVEEPKIEEVVVLEATTEKGNYVASKNGTKYHLPWCPGAKQMNEENKVWFETKEEAEAAGYSPAANCPGL